MKFENCDDALLLQLIADRQTGALHALYDRYNRLAFSVALAPGQTFSLFIVAFDAAGNYSKQSNSVTFTLPRDLTSPAKPTVSVTDVGPTYISLAWSAADDDPHLRYNVSMNGSIIQSGSTATTQTFAGLRPSTTYTFVVQAIDSGGNRSPLSDPVSATTEAADPNDTTPPTTPANFSGSSFDDGETWLSWQQSTDNVDPQFAIRYDVYVDGLLDHSLVGYGSTVIYVSPGVFHTFAVVAVDSAGNQSAPATLTICAGTSC
jgi:chitinase